MDLIEDIGPILGIVAFLGFAVLALLIVLQAREVRRLREWAGRAPERSLEADEAVQATAEEQGEAEPEPGRLAAARERLAAAWGPRWAEIDRRSPVDPRWLAAVAVAALVAAAALTSGFGLVGGGDDGRAERREARERPAPPPLVTVLNATQVEDPVAPSSAVPGVADAVADDVVAPAGYRIARTGDAPAGVEETVLMFEPGAEDDARRLARRLRDDLGTVAAEPITPEVSALAGRAELVLLVGRADSAVAGGAEPAIP